jgi:hypothetical protein
MGHPRAHIHLPQRPRLFTQSKPGSFETNIRRRQRILGRWFKGTPLHGFCSLKLARKICRPRRPSRTERGLSPIFNRLTWEGPGVAATPINSQRAPMRASRTKPQFTSRQLIAARRLSRMMLNPCVCPSRASVQPAHKAQPVPDRSNPVALLSRPV